jgi:hypothetical protein
MCKNTILLSLFTISIVLLIYYNIPINETFRGYSSRGSRGIVSTTTRIQRANVINSSFDNENFSSNHSDKNKLGGAAIAGIVIGSIIGFIILLVILMNIFSN